MSFTSWLRSKFSTGIRPSRPRSHTVRFRPGLEALENRLVPTFNASAPYAVGGYAQVVATADLNNDGKLDIITGNSVHPDGAAWGQTPTIQVILANGGRKAGFELARSNSVESAPTSLVVGDFDSDGKQDVAAGSFWGISVLLGKGDGTFRSQVFTNPNFFLPNGFSDDVVAAGHFNGDGRLDLVTSSGVLWGNGDGSFGSAVYGDPYDLEGGYRTPGRPLAVGDANKDGRPEFLVLSGTDSATGHAFVSVQRANGDGTFGTPQTLATYGNPLAGGSVEIKAGAVADFNKDGKLDIAVSYAFYGNPWSYDGAFVETFVANASGGFGTAGTSQFSVGTYSGYAMQLAAADFNGDGIQDLITVGATGTGSVLLGKGDGSFSAGPTIITLLDSISFAVGDFNGDGYADLASLNFNEYYVDVLMNDKQWGTGGRNKNSRG